MNTKSPDHTVQKPDADSFGRQLGPGIGINLLVRDTGASARFQVEALGAGITYLDDDFAILTGFGSTWMLHHDRTYHAHPLRGALGTGEVRGVGIELRLYGCDPDRAEAACEPAGGTVLATSADKPHGLREAYLLDAEGYLWVPCVPKPE